MPHKLNKELFLIPNIVITNMKEITFEIGVLFPFPKTEVRLAKKELIRQLEMLLEEFEVDIFVGKAHSQRWWDVQITCLENEKKIILSILRASVGIKQKIHRLEKGMIILGRLVDPYNTGFGWFIDIGLEPRKDALLPLYSLRESLFNGAKVPLREITDAYGFFDKVPIQVEITKITKRKGEYNIDVKLSEEWTEQLLDWAEGENEWLIIWGTSREKLIHALKSAGHYQDIIGIDSMDTLTHIIFLKQNTRGTGLVPRLGPHLKTAIFGVGSPTKIRELRKNYQ